MWQLLKPVPKSLPDQGIDYLERVGQMSGRLMQIRAPSALAAPTSPSVKKLVKCLMCGKRHEPLCEMPEGSRKKQRERIRQAKSAGKGKSKGKGSGKTPEKAEK